MLAQMAQQRAKPFYKILLFSGFHIVLEQWACTHKLRPLADSPLKDRIFSPESSLERLLQFVGGATDGLIER